MSLPSDWPGFLDWYSTSGVEEDKAQVFAYMVVHGDLVAQRAAIDDVLRAKVDRMIELLQQFCPEMNAAFWEAAAGVARPPG